MTINERTRTDVKKIVETKRKDVTQQVAARIVREQRRIDGRMSVVKRNDARVNDEQIRL